MDFINKYYLFVLLYVITLFFKKYYGTISFFDFNGFRNFKAFNRSIIYFKLTRR